ICAVPAAPFMMKLYPLTFEPIFKERIWGGRNLETLYGKPLPPGLLIGESWEICDRPGDQSVVANGPLRGRTLHWLMEQCPEALLGARHPMPARFPLLIKIIDAQQTLSLQVHPPAGLAAQLGGEPKTEMWYVARAGPTAELFVGLRNGVTRASFEQKRIAQSVAECFHRIQVKPGDAMFLPSGRVHALGAETVIFEIQQNSDTTYRVFDWNRVDRDGNARELHVPQSLASIDFNDFEPELLPQTTVDAAPGAIRPLVKSELFEAAVRTLPGGERLDLTDGRMQIIGVIEGVLRIGTAEEKITLQAGQFCLVPAQGAPATGRAESWASFLQVY
ncbi:MAG TPA: type I phosphomannose isomerase catalytic subunit, partial [Candidatus Saccharimonadales bacterium]|nr:type I phosphomannose isomerase catalytic subunit [Candidatus Saccharimonadales bacterium]